MKFPLNLLNIKYKCDKYYNQYICLIVIYLLRNKYITFLIYLLRLLFDADIRGHFEHICHIATSHMDRFVFS